MRRFAFSMKIDVPQTIQPNSGPATVSSRTECRTKQITLQIEAMKVAKNAEDRTMAPSIRARMAPREATPGPDDAPKISRARNSSTGKACTGAYNRSDRKKPPRHCCQECAAHEWGALGCTKPRGRKVIGLSRGTRSWSLLRVR